MCGQSWEAGNVHKVTQNAERYEVQGQISNTLEVHSCLKKKKKKQKTNIGLPLSSQIKY